MKRNNKLKRWIWFIGAAAVSIVTLVFAFIPMQFPKGEYYSFFGAQRYGIDLSDKIVVTYTYTTTAENTEKDVESACNKIEDLLHDEGYISATAVALGSNKIEVTVAKPDKGEQLQNVLQLVGSQGIGVGSLELKTENSSTAEALLKGSKHVKNVSVISSSGYYYTVIEFTAEGKALLSAYESQAASSSKTVSYYLYFGGSNSITGGYAFTPSSNFVNNSLYIGGFETADTAETYKLICEAGSLKVNLNSASIRDINYQTNENKNVSRIVLWSLSLLIVVTFLTLIGARHGIFALISSLIGDIITIGISLLLCATMPWIELSSSSLVAYAIGLAVVNISMFSMFERMRREKIIGKDFAMSVESGYNKSLISTIVIGVSMLFIGIISAIAFEGAIQSCAIIISIMGTFNVLSTLAIAKLTFNSMSNVMKINKATVIWEGSNNESANI